MAGSGVASTRARKAEVIEEVSGLLSKSTLVFAIPASNIGANDVVRLRKEMPDGCTARVVKNKLMRIACKGSEFEELSEITTGENFWMFVEGEENLGAPIKYIVEFAKSMDKEKVRHGPRWCHDTCVFNCHFSMCHGLYWYEHQQYRNT